MDNYNYPLGSDTPDAPWNQVENEEVEVEVTVSITMSKTFKIKTSNYDTEYDGEMMTYKFNNLLEDCKEQHVLPDMAYNYVNGIMEKEDLKDWIVDDIEAIKD